MCLAVPMKLVEVRDDDTAVAELDGARHEVDLSLIDGAVVGEYVIVHTGFAVEKFDREEADARLALFRQLAEAYRDGDDPGGKAP